MEYGVLFRVREPGWDALEPHVMRPARAARESLAAIAETALALTTFEANLVAAKLGEPRDARVERNKRRLDIEDIQRRTRALEQRRARMPAAADAWAKLAPAEWPDEQHRAFVGAHRALGVPPAERSLRVSWGSFDVDRVPATNEAVLALVSDVEGVRRAEAHARDACASLSLPAERIVWLVEPEPRLFDFIGASKFRTSTDEALAIDPARLAAGEIIPPEPPREKPDDAWRFVWLRLAKRDLVRMNVGAKAFEPIVEIARLGYALVDVVDGAVVLAAASPRIDRLFDVLV